MWSLISLICFRSRLFIYKRRNKMILTETEDQMVKLIVEATQKIPPL